MWYTILYLDGDGEDGGNGDEGDDEDAKQHNTETQQHWKSVTFSSEPETFTVRLKESNVLTHAGSLVYLTELKCNEELSEADGREVARSNKSRFARRRH